jgi:hypothetical protein
VKGIGEIHSPGNLYDMLISTESPAIFLLALTDLELYIREINNIEYNEVKKLNIILF